MITREQTACHRAVIQYLQFNICDTILLQYCGAIMTMQYFLCSACNTILSIQYLQCNTCGAILLMQYFWYTDVDVDDFGELTKLLSIHLYNNLRSVTLPTSFKRLTHAFSWLEKMLPTEFNLLTLFWTAQFIGTFLQTSFCQLIQPWTDTANHIWKVTSYKYAECKYKHTSTNTITLSAIAVFSVLVERPYYNWTPLSRILNAPHW